MNTPLTFQGLITRNIISEDIFKRFFSKVDDIRKMSQSVVEYLLLIHKGMDMYHGSLVKQCELLEAQLNNDMSDDKRYYLQFAMIFQAVSINFEQFNSNFVANLKEYHLSTCMEVDELTTSYLDPLVNSYRKYKSSEESVIDSGKKWLKGQKQLSDSIKSYNESFVDPKLIYNKQQTNKRYFYCQTSYQNVLKQEGNISQKLQKLNQNKKQCIYSHNKFILQHNNSFAFIHERIIMEAKNILTSFSNVHKMVVSDMASKKKAFEQTEFLTFLYTHPQIDNQKHFFDLPPNYQSEGNFPIFLQNPQSIKESHLKLYSKWLSQYCQFLKDCGQNSKKLMKRLVQFLSETTKTLERMSNFILKQMPIFYDKLKKKITEMFTIKTLDYIKSINGTLETSMRIYQKLIKTSYQKLEILNSIINEDQKMSDMFFKEYHKQLDTFNNQIKTMNTNNNFVDLRNAINQKAAIIKFCLSSFGEKITKNNGVFTKGVKGLLGELLSSFNQIFIYSSQYQHTYFGMEFIDNLNAIKQVLLQKQNNMEKITQDIQEQSIKVQNIQRFKHTQYENLKRPEGILPKQERQKQQNVEKTASLDQSDFRERSVSSPIKKQSTDINLEIKEKKNYDFLKKKVTFQEGQIFKQTFKCALYDKILLQGRLYVTNMRLCFHSYFNTANLFFGTTFLQIPKKDIIKAEKRYNAKIFDNSVSITTVNGQVFFTSFLSRDIAFKQITDTFELKVQDQDNNQNEQQQKQEQDAQNTVTQQALTNKQQQIEQQPVEQKQVDDITQQQVIIRLQKFQEVTNNKMQKVSTNIIKNGNCLYLLKKLFNNQQYLNSGAKYSSFYDFFKQKQGEKEIFIDKWQPSIEAYLNKNNIKKDTPLRFNRKCRYNHILPKSNIPFMPKFCKSQQSHRMSIISKDRFIVDCKVTSQGAPYTQTFIVYTRQQYNNKENGIQVIAFIHIQFLKKSMVQGIISKQSVKQFSEGQQTYIKLINKIISSDPIFKRKKGKSTKLQGTNVDGQTQNLNTTQDINDQKQDESLNQNPQNYQTKYSQLLKQHEELKKKYSILKYIIIALIIFEVLSFIL